MQQPARDASPSEWSVYADALQEANDPRGELIALELAVGKGMGTADRDAYVARHKDALLGPAARYFDDLTIQWHMCLIDRLELRLRATDTAPRVITEVLSSPAAGELRTFSLVGIPAGRETLDLTHALATLASELPRTCTSLALIDDRARATRMMASRDFDPPDNLVQFGSLARWWPRLVELTIETADAEQLDLGGAIDAPELTAFTLRCLRFGGGDNELPVAERLATATWPKLRTLALRLPEEFGANIVADADAYIPMYHGDEDYEDRYDEADAGENYVGMNWSRLRELLVNVRDRPLERLALTSFDSADALLEVLGEVGLPATLTELDLSDSSISSIAWFVEHEAQLGSLRRLVLERTPLAEADAQRLARELGITVAHSAGSGATYRYVVGQE